MVNDPFDPKDLYTNPHFFLRRNTGSNLPELYNSFQIPCREVNYETMELEVERAISNLFIEKSFRAASLP